MDSHTNPILLQFKMEAILREMLSAYYFVRQTRCVVSGDQLVEFFHIFQSLNFFLTLTSKCYFAPLFTG